MFRLAHSTRLYLYHARGTYYPCGKSSSSTLWPPVSTPTKPTKPEKLRVSAQFQRKCNPSSLFRCCVKLKKKKKNCTLCHQGACITYADWSKNVTDCFFVRGKGMKGNTSSSSGKQLEVKSSLERMLLFELLAFSRYLLSMSYALRIPCLDPVEMLPARTLGTQVRGLRGRLTVSQQRAFNPHQVSYSLFF